ncbi:MAG TPA: nucleotide exchange factor GrpE [Candidatus Agrococcus pullicola]|uniref:Protein GrpE n=1 Tax=Candidatus Agrococcus pullicola TaxID=2838429 RepID=A0A9D1YWU8_9MICO|nr:nucleotide exchange factor GrpE [Candidatus Agrococcus pullicola]
MAKDSNPEEEPVFRDKRRIDPETGELRDPGASVSAEAPASEDAPENASNGDEALSDEDEALLAETRASMQEEVEAAQAEAAQHKDALARLQAEHVNYRNRIERERAGDRDATVAGVVEKLLPALDDLDLARKHGDLDDGPLALVAQKIEGAFEALDVHRVGEVGERFDIAKHEAIAQLPSADATEETVVDVVQIGYRIGSRLLRAAKVAVQVPAE